MEKKKSKKIIIILVLIIILLIAVTGFFGYKIWKESQTTGTDWGDEYLNSIFQDTKEYEKVTHFDDNSNPVYEKVDYYANAKEGKIQCLEKQFVEDKPCVIVSYKNENNHQNMNIYLFTKEIKEDGKKRVTSYNAYLGYDNEDRIKSEYKGAEVDYSIVLLYNKELEQYLWYVKSVFPDGSVGFAPITYYTWDVTVTSDKVKMEVFSAEEMQGGQTDESGTPVISKFEEKFVEVENYEDTSVEVGELHNIEENELRKKLKESIKKYKNLEQTVTEEIKTATESKTQEIEEKQAQIKTAEEEKAQKEAEEKAKAEEEAKKKAEEEAKAKAEEEANGFKVGNYTFKYGTYKGTGGYENSNEGSKLVLKSNGTYTMTQNNGKTTSGTFKPSSDGWINFDDGSWTYKAIDNNVMGDVGGYYERFKWVSN